MNKLTTCIFVLFSTYSLIGHATDDFITNHLLITTPQTTSARALSDHSDQVKQIIEFNGQTIQGNQQVTKQTSIITLSKSMTNEDYQNLVNDLKTQGIIVEPDIVFHHKEVPNDPLYPSLLGMHGTFSLNVDNAWNLTKGTNSVVVAVLDTGITNHPDINPDMILPGFDFVTGSQSIDGNDWDTNPQDPGDAGCGYNSSWHGTHIIGTIAASFNNSTGVVGIAPNVKILPVRVLGKCGDGAMSGIALGIKWAAGLPVDGVPINAYPAQVINLSLGGNGRCDTMYTLKSVIDEVHQKTNVIIIAAGGNDGFNAETQSPVSCDHVIGVGASHTGGGSWVDWSGHGSMIDIAAPGTSILSTSNNGLTTYTTPTYQYKSGTSMSTAHVSGVVALMLSMKATLQRSEVLSIIQQTSTPFPDGGGCDSQTLCGPGIINAYKSVIRSMEDITKNTTSTTTSTTISSTTTTTFAQPHVDVGGGGGGFDWLVLSVGALFLIVKRKVPQSHTR